MERLSNDIITLESRVVTLFDGRVPARIISKKLCITYEKTLRILERHARVIPAKCLMCKQPMTAHMRCPHCEILLHFAQSRCWPPCTDRNYQSNI